MTEPHVAQFFSIYLLWHCWSLVVCSKPISSRPEDDCAKVGFEKITKRENPSSPEPSSITEKRFSAPRDSRLSMEVIQALGKHHLLLYLVFLLATSSITGQQDPSIVGFSKKGRLYACMRTKTLDTLQCSMQVSICEAYVQLTGLWNISICISPFSHNLFSWCGHGWIECICRAYHVKCWIRRHFMSA